MSGTRDPIISGAGHQSCRNRKSGNQGILRDHSDVAPQKVLNFRYIPRSHYCRITESFRVYSKITLLSYHRKFTDIFRDHIIVVSQKFSRYILRSYYCRIRESFRVYSGINYLTLSQDSIF